MPKVVGISGSERLRGNTEQFVQRALDIISEDGIETELITLADKEIAGGCTGCFWCTENIAECPIKDDFMPIWRKMCEADGIILGAPVYFGATPAKLKALITRAGILNDGRISPDRPVNIIGRERWPETTKPPGLLARKVGGAIVVAQRDGTLFTLAELSLWFQVNNFIIVSSNYWVEGIEQVGRISGGVGGGGTRVPSEDGKIYKHVTDILQVDREAEMTLERFAENMAWLVNATYKIRGTPEEQFRQSRLSSPKWMDPELRKKILGNSYPG